MNTPTNEVNGISVDPFDFIDPDDTNKPPVVTIRIGDQVIRFLDPAKARELAGLLTAAANEAERQ